MSRDQLHSGFSVSWLRRSVVGLFASKILASVAVLFAGMLLLRYLEPSEYGYYQVVISIASFTMTVFSLGFSPLISRFIPELLERGNSRTAAKFLLIVLAIRAVLITMLLLIGLVFFESIESFFGLGDVDKYGSLAISAIVLGTYLGSSVGPVVLGAYARQVEIGIGSVISAVLRIVVIGLVVIFDFGLVGILIAISIVEIVMLLGYLARVFFVVSIQTHEKDESISESLKVRAFRYSIPLSLVSAARFFESRFGMIFVISSSLGTAAAGNYSFVFVMLQFGAIVNPVYTLNTLIDNVIVRRSVHLDQKELLARGQRMFISLSVYTGVPIALYLLVIRAPLSQAFGFEHAGTGWLFLWAGLFFITNSMQLAYGNIFTQLEVPKYRLLFGAIGILGVGIAFSIIHEYGIVGVAAVAGISSSLVLLVQHWISRKILRVPVGIYPAMLFKVFAINAIAGMATSTVVFLSDRFVPTALITFSVFIVIYLALTFIMKPFSKEDVKSLQAILPGWTRVVLGPMLR